MLYHVNKIMKPRERERERDKLRHKVYELVWERERKSKIWGSSERDKIERERERERVKVREGDRSFHTIVSTLV